MFRPKIQKTKVGMVFSGSVYMLAKARWPPDNTKASQSPVPGMDGKTGRVGEQDMPTVVINDDPSNSKSIEN
jgi:hypothetical protein